MQEININFEKSATAGGTRESRMRALTMRRSARPTAARTLLT